MIAEQQYHSFPVWVLCTRRIVVWDEQTGLIAWSILRGDLLWLTLLGGGCVERGEVPVQVHGPITLVL